MKTAFQLVSAFTLVIGLSQLANAQSAQTYELCGVPVLPYGCNVDVCTVALRTNGGYVNILPDSTSRIVYRDLVELAKGGGEQCFIGYSVARTFHIIDYAN